MIERCLAIMFVLSACTATGVASLVAQIPGADRAIEAAGEDGWVAVLLVVVVIAGMCGVGWLVRQNQVAADKREERMSRSIEDKEQVDREDRAAMTSVMRDCAVAMTNSAESSRRIAIAFEKFEQRLSDRPCLMTKDESHG